MGGGAPNPMSRATANGIAHMTNRRALVDSFASIATLQARITATVANQAPPTSHIRDTLFMISTFTRADLEVLATRSTRGTVPARGRANETCLSRAGGRLRCPRLGVIACLPAAEVGGDLMRVSCAFRSMAEVGLSARTR